MMTLAGLTTGILTMVGLDYLKNEKPLQAILCLGLAGTIFGIALSKILGLLP